MKLFLQTTTSALFLLSAGLHGQQVKPAPMAPMKPIPDSVTYAPSNPKLPTIFVVGDSTSVGWGPYLTPFFDTSRVNVVQAGAAGRSSRTYITEGLWDRVKKQLRSNDIVLVQFGHNDLFALNDPDRARGSIKGTGDEAQEIDNMVTHQHEMVHTFGWYLRQFVEETKTKGATAILMSPTPDNVWQDGKMEGDRFGYARWTSDIAAQEHVDFVNITVIMTDRFMGLGQTKTTELFGANDKTHLTKIGWQLNALWTFAALEYLSDKPVDPFVSSYGKQAMHASSK